MKKYKYEQYDYSGIDGCEPRFNSWTSATIFYEPIRDEGMRGGWEVTLQPPTEVSFVPTYVSTNDSARTTVKKKQSNSNSIAKFYNDWIALHNEYKKRREEERAKYFKRKNYFKSLRSKKR